MHTMHTFYFFFYNPLYSKGFRGVEGMHQVMHTARIPMHTTGFFSGTGDFFSNIGKKPDIAETRIHDRGTHIPFHG